MHCTIKKAICCLLAERNLSEDMWCELLGFIEFAVNSAVVEGTGASRVDNWGAATLHTGCGGSGWQPCRC